jgi:type I restriction enzyme R subunit
MRDKNEISERATRNRYIDVALRDTGWTNIVDFEENKKYDFAAVREYETDNGPADYVLFNNGRALAAVEAKKISLGPQNVLVQAERYSKGFSDGEFDFNGHHLPFVYSTNGEVIWFRDLRRKNSRSTRLQGFTRRKHWKKCCKKMLTSTSLGLTKIQ